MSVTPTMAPLATTPIPSTVTTGPNSMSKADEFKIINDIFFQYMDMKPKPWAIVISVGLCLGWCLSGIVFFQAWMYARTCRVDSWPLKVFVGLLVGGNAAIMVFQTYTFGGIVDHWDEYGNWFYYDIVFQFTAVLIMTIIHVPFSTAYFGLRAWALNGKPKYFVMIALASFIAFEGSGLALIIKGYTIPVPKSVTFQNQMTNWQEQMKHVDVLQRCQKVWGVIAFTVNLALTVGIIVSLRRNRTGEARMDQTLSKLKSVTLQSMVPPTVAMAVYSGLILGNKGFTGWARLFLYTLAPLYTHSVLFALLSRKAIRKHMEERPGTIHMRNIDSPFEVPHELRSTDQSGRPISVRSAEYSDRHLLPEMMPLPPDPKEALKSLRLSSLQAHQRRDAADAEKALNAWDDPQTYSYGGKVNEKMKLGTSQMFL